jgi:adenosylcobinamide-GDP ribazoletransferase
MSDTIPPPEHVHLSEQLHVPEQPREREQAQEPVGEQLLRQTGEWAAFVTAVQFLTRVSWPFSTSSSSASGPASASVLSRCPVYFPIVGGLIGVITSIVLGVASLFWPVWLAAIVALAVEARLTGALHEDAVADFCDAFGGGWTRDDVLRILKDSRIGSYGALGLGLAVALRLGATMEIVQQYGRENWPTWSAALVAGSALSRWVMVAVMVFVPPAPSRDSLSRDIASRLNVKDLATASLWMLPAIAPFFLVLPLRAVISIVVLIPLVLWFQRLVRRRLGGVTGDCLGCIGYMSHVTVLLVTAAGWQR